MQKNKGYLSFVFRKFSGEKHLLQTLILLFVLCLTACSAHADKPEINRFIDNMVKKHHFNRQALQQLFDTIQAQHSIIASFIKPKEGLTWSDYKPMFVSEQRIHKGVAFWKQYQQTLSYAHRVYGVPPSIIVAILGIETRYGKVMGNYRVLDALSTLSFNHTRRADFFQNQLEQFLLLGRENPVINPETTKGSYAGAIGQAQFMPSNYRQLAVDASHKGYSDLIHNSEDAILSIANYLKHHGWVSTGPVAIPIKNKNHVENPIPMSLLGEYSTLNTLEKYHLYPEKPFPPTVKARLIELPLSAGKEYWLGFTNFDVIRKYNGSSLYAMAIYQLSESINRNYYQQEHQQHGNKK